MEPLSTRYAGVVSTCRSGMNSLYSDPHPFISLLTPTKGKKILPRLTRHLSSGYMLTLLTLLVACFGQLDVVKQAPILDSFQDTHEHADVDRQTQAFLGSVMQSILPVVSVATLRLVTGLLGLLLTRSDIVEVARSKVWFGNDIYQGLLPDLINSSLASHCSLCSLVGSKLSNRLLSLQMRPRQRKANSGT